MHIAWPTRAPLPPIETSRRAALLPLRISTAQLVVMGAFLWVAEHLVRLVGFLEFFLSGFIVGVAVGMILKRQFAISFFDLILACPSTHPQNLVIIFVFHKGSTPKLIL